MNFKYGSIYELYNSKNNFIYRGSTTDTLNNRLHKHKWDAGNRDSKLYTKMREIGIEHFNIKLIAHCFYIDENELLKLEDYYIALIPEDRKLNSYRAILSKEEKKEKKKKDNIEYNKKRVICECGIESLKKHLSRHKKSQIHQMRMSKIIE